MKYGVIPMFVLFFLSCSEDKVSIASANDLKGTWIELDTRTDTLSFVSLDHMEVVHLLRGKEMKDGYLLPKPGSGPYVYKLAEGKISLLWMLSSDANFRDYDFNIMGNRLKIGNFYGSASGETLVFEKLD